MVAEAHAWVDVEGAVREWARDTVAGANRRVFFAANSDTVDPQVVVQRISGTDEDCSIQFDVWAATKALAAQVAAELAAALDSLSRYSHGGAVLLGADVLSVRWLPDPESGAPRYIIDATISAVEEPENVASS